MKYGSLFTGIGGFDLGLDRAGMECAWQVEIDDYATKVLERHWPEVKRYRDIREVGAATLAPVDLICGGFPCQDISIAGSGAGMDGQHSSLWNEFARVVGELRPKFVLVENSSALIFRGLDRILGGMADLGYDSEWEGIPAAAVGAPHLRARIWILSYSAGFGNGLQNEAILSRGHGALHSSWWASEPDVGRVADGVPARVDRLRCLGNAVVPQVVEWIGRRIVEGAE